MILQNKLYKKVSCHPQSCRPPPAGQLSGVSISVRSLCLPSPAFCWHHSQALSNAAPLSVPKPRNPWSRIMIRGSACGVIRLSMLGGKSGVLAAGVPGLPSPRLTQSMVLATAPMKCIPALRLKPHPPSLFGSAVFSLIKSQLGFERWGVSPRGHWHSRPCEVHSATVSCTFRSKREKNPAVFADCNASVTTCTPSASKLELEYQDWARLQGRGPHTAGGHGRNRPVGWQAQ